MTQLIKHMLCNHEALSPITSARIKGQSMEMPILDSGAGQEETRGSLEFAGTQFSLLGSSLMKIPHLKREDRCL